MTNSTKKFILSSFQDIEKTIEKNTCYIQGYASDAFRVHSANAENIATYASRLAEARGKRDGIIFTLQNLGYELVWDEEYLVDFSERKEN